MHISFISNSFFFSVLQNKCGKERWNCENNSTCQSGFKQKRYRCSFTTEFEGEHCENGNYVYANYHLAETLLNIKHSAVEISIFTCANHHQKTHISRK